MPLPATLSDEPPALVVSDMDGTLLGADGTVSERNAAALVRAQAAGARVVIATGRPIVSLGPVIDAGFSGIAVCMNGAVVYDIADRKVLAATELQPAAMAAFVADLERTPTPFALAADRIGAAAETFWAEPSYFHPWADRFYHRVPRGELLSVPAAKLLVYYDTPTVEAFGRAAACAHGRVSVTYSSGDGLVEVGATGVNKGAALAKLAAGWGIEPADVLAFGDMPNDIEMLRWAGRSVAMGDAPAEVRQAARHVGPGHDDDGVAQVLERWF